MVFRMGTLENFIGGTIRHIDMCKLVHGKDVYDYRLSMLLMRLHIPYYPPTMYEMGFMAVQQYMPRTSNWQTGEVESYLSAGWHGTDGNWVGQTLSGNLLRFVGPNACKKRYKDIDEYFRNHAIENNIQPIACFTHRDCTDDDCVNYKHAYVWDDGNGVYIHRTNILVSVLQTNSIPSYYANSEYIKLNTISSWVPDVQKEVMAYMPEHCSDDFSGHMEFDLKLGIY